MKQLPILHIKIKCPFCLYPFGINLSPSVKKGDIIYRFTETICPKCEHGFNLRNIIHLIALEKEDNND